VFLTLCLAWEGGGGGGDFWLVVVGLVIKALNIRLSR